MKGHILASFIMMRLGNFGFGINSAAYQELQQRTEYTWAEQPRFGQRAALQFTGPGADTISLSGVLFPEFSGSGGSINTLRRLAAKGQPQLLVSGLGAVMGRWVILGIEEGQSVFAAAGRPRKQEFTVNLRKYDDGA